MITRQSFGVVEITAPFEGVVDAEDRGRLVELNRPVALCLGVTFIWDENEEEAILLKKKSDQYVRFQWSHADSPEEYFELRIVVDEITKDVSLFVTDFAEEDEVEESKMLWENQIDDLKHVLGSA